MTTIIARHPTYELPPSLAGYNALVLSIVATAHRDLTNPYTTHGGFDDEVQRDAALYFLGPLYARHLELLGLPPAWLPDGIRIVDDESNDVVVVVEDG